MVTSPLADILRRYCRRENLKSGALFRAWCWPVFLTLVFIGAVCAEAFMTSTRKVDVVSFIFLLVYCGGGAVFLGIMAWNDRYQYASGRFMRKLPFVQIDDATFLEIAWNPEIPSEIKSQLADKSRVLGKLWLENIAEIDHRWYLARDIERSRGRPGFQALVQAR